MIDHVLGRPSPTLRRTQIFLVLFFWVWRLYKGDGAVPRPSRTTTAAGPLPSGRAGGIRSRGRVSWLLKLWVTLVGKRGYGMGWIGRINQRMSERISGSITRCTLIGVERWDASLKWYRRTLHSLPAHPRDLDFRLRHSTSG